ncbi:MULTISPECIES: DUF805 domain-containing protein [unclassified Pseudoalteromonas]|uniref:DUF805 domain-containing protein n=1 Tax=unclassified Pseudoalteromonas TaxID=194690 RepID=UPI001408FD5C|nr:MULTISPECIES: DUF805 domain-containing protein [unclassified Pseudoalteromonas]MBH0026937.1 DUF805 domain-containing protein [Pseudoalteromonas sp. SWN29]
MEYFMEAMRRYTDFSGRTRRKDFWMFILFYAIFYVVCAVVDGVIGTAPIVTTLFSLAMLIPSISIAARRLHDTGRSGWWQLIALIPLIGAIVLLVFYVLDSHQGENDFGPNPKELAVEPTTV